MMKSMLIAPKHLHRAARVYFWICLVAVVVAFGFMHLKTGDF